MHVLLRDGIYRDISINSFDLDLVVFTDFNVIHFTNKIIVRIIFWGYVGIIGQNQGIRKKKY